MIIIFTVSARLDPGNLITDYSVILLIISLAAANQMDKVYHNGGIPPRKRNTFHANIKKNTTGTTSIKKYVRATKKYAVIDLYNPLALIFSSIKSLDLCLPTLENNSEGVVKSKPQHIMNFFNFQLWRV